MTSISKRIEQLRGKKGLSRPALAAALGFPKTSIEKFETGRLTPNQEQQKALVHIWLHTGRHHQIRVQMAGAGMPLLGDRKYGIVQGAGELALCADRLQLVHPGTGKKMEFHCKPQGFWFQRFLQEGASCPG